MDVLSKEVGSLQKHFIQAPSPTATKLLRLKVGVIKRKMYGQRKLVARMGATSSLRSGPCTKRVKAPPLPYHSAMAECMNSPWHFHERRHAHAKQLSASVLKAIVVPAVHTHV